MDFCMKEKTCGKFYDMTCDCKKCKHYRFKDLHPKCDTCETGDCRNCDVKDDISCKKCVRCCKAAYDPIDGCEHIEDCFTRKASEQSTKYKRKFKK